MFLSLRKDDSRQSWNLMVLFSIQPMSLIFLGSLPVTSVASVTQDHVQQGTCQLLTDSRMLESLGLGTVDIWGRIILH